MFSAHLHDIIASMPAPVILLEGSRTVPFEEGRRLAIVGRNLAETFPNATFRSGNEEGADQALVAGVATVPGAKVELVLQGRGARSARRPPSATCKALRELPHEECQQLIRESLAVNPRNRSLYKIYLRGQYDDPSYTKAMNLLRDAFKVAGSPALQLAPASMVLVFLNAKRGTNIGTTHTIRLSQRRNVPVFHQEDWLSPPNANPSSCDHHEHTLERSRQDTRPLLLQAS